MAIKTERINFRVTPERKKAFMAVAAKKGVEATTLFDQFIEKLEKDLDPETEIAAG